MAGLKDKDMVYIKQDLMHERQTHNAELQRILQLCDDSEADLCWSHFDTLFDDLETTKQENKKADAFSNPTCLFPHG